MSSSFGETMLTALSVMAVLGLAAFLAVRLAREHSRRRTGHRVSGSEERWGRSRSADGDAPPLRLPIQSDEEWLEALKRSFGKVEGGADAPGGRREPPSVPTGSSFAGSPEEGGFPSETSAHGNSSSDGDVPGRSPAVLVEHLQRTDLEASRMKVVMDLEDGCWRIVNVSPTNPVSVNGEVVPEGESHALSEGDLVRMGDATFLFRE